MKRAFASFLIFAVALFFGIPPIGSAPNSPGQAQSGQGSGPGPGTPGGGTGHGGAQTEAADQRGETNQTNTHDQTSSRGHHHKKHHQGSEGKDQEQSRARGNQTQK